MSLSLDDHARVPPIGLGTWQNDDPEQCAETVRTAIDMGYRHIDTAQLYDNEEAVGEGIHRAEVDRDRLFVASKVDFNNCAPADVRTSTEQSCDRLGVDTIDLMYVHWPAGQYRASETLPALEELAEDGVIRHIGLSNFTIPLLDEAREILDHPVYAHQVEMHPLLSQEELRDYGRRHSIHTVAYSPFRHGTLFQHDVLQDIARATDATPAQVALAWIVEKGAFPIPKATGEDHLRNNLEAGSLELTEDQVDRIDAIDREDRFLDPPFAPW